MSLLLVLNQPLRMSRAISYATMRNEAETLILTSGSASPFSVPSTTSILTFDDLDVSTPSGGKAGLAMGRTERWVKGGSNAGAKVGRWIRSAEWRLRHLDRIRSIIEHRRDEDSMSHHSAMILALESVAAAREIDEIVVFDLFDLPAVLAFAEPRALPVKVR